MRLGIQSVEREKRNSPNDQLLKATMTSKTKETEGGLHLVIHLMMGLFKIAIFEVDVSLK